MRQDDPSKLKSPKSGDDDFSSALRKEKRPALSRSVQNQLGKRLQTFYDSLALGETPVPERFIEIINQLEQAEPDQWENGAERRKRHS